MTRFAVSLDDLLWIEAESEEEALKKAEEEFYEHLNDRSFVKDFSVLDKEE